MTKTFVNIIDKTRQSKHCGFSIYIFDNSKSKSMVTGQVGQGGEDGLVWSGLWIEG